jgi:hypothetical protein
MMLPCFIGEITMASGISKMPSRCRAIWRCSGAGTLRELSTLRPSGRCVARNVHLLSTSGCGGVHKWRYPNSWMVYNGKSIYMHENLWELMRTGGTPISGHLHVYNRYTVDTNHKYRAALCWLVVSALWKIMDFVSWMIFHSQYMESYKRHVPVTTNQYVYIYMYVYVYI